MSRPNNKLAAIDVGSNSALLAIVSYDRNGHFKIEKEKIETPRVADCLVKSKKNTAIRKLVRTLKKFKKECARSKVQKIICAGTEALRKLPDNKKITAYVLKKTGIKIQTVTPRREAMLSYLSATEELPEKIRDRVIVIDIGAASTEVAGPIQNRCFVKSFKVGALSLKNRFDVTYPLLPGEINKMIKYISNIFKGKLPICNDKILAGVGGTITSIPSLLMGMKSYDAQKLDLKKVTRSKIDGLLKQTMKMKLESLEKLQGMPKGRADIFLPGLLILAEIMDVCRSSSILVRNRGLRFGLLFDHFKKSPPEDQNQTSSKEPQG